MDEEGAGKSFCSVCLVDDDPAMLDLMEAMLDADPDNYYAISKFTDPVEALKSILKNPPDMVVLDLYMPVMNGFEVCQKIKKSIITRFVSVILVTGYNSSLVCYEGLLKYRADSYVPKPFHCERFLEVMHDMITLKKGKLPAHKSVFAGMIAKVL